MTRYANMAFGSEKASKPYIAYAACMPQIHNCVIHHQGQGWTKYKTGVPKQNFLSCENMRT
jgi:hypothetical protein